MELTIPTLSIKVVGELTASSYSNLTFVGAMAFNENGSQVYFNSGSNAVEVWNYNSGQITPLESSTADFLSVPIDAYGLDMAFHPTGNWAYVLSDSTIFQYSLDRTTGIMESLNPTGVQSEPNPIGLMVEPSGRWAYVLSTDYGNNESTVALYEISSTGLLNEVNSAIVAISGMISSDTGSLTISPSGRWVYLLDSSNGEIHQYGLNPNNGELTSSSLPTLTMGSSPSNMVFDPTEKWAYLADSVNNNILVFSLATASGQLILSETLPLASGASPSLLAYHPTLKVLYVVNAGSSTIAQFSVNEATGTLTLMNTLSLPANYRMISFSVNSSGQEAYLLGEPYNSWYPAYSVQKYNIDATTGILNLLSQGDLTAFGTIENLYLFLKERFGGHSFYEGV